MGEVLMQPGDVIRVHDWPATRGERFVVVWINDGGHQGPIVHARRLERGVGTVSRFFPVDRCQVDQKARRERV